MGIGEKDPGGGQAIEVRGLGLGMPGKATDPVVEIVDCDEQYVGVLGGVDDNRIVHDTSPAWMTTIVNQLSFTPIVHDTVL